jgi:acyl-CoA reductase-like NAD-dependent aldehyde dehydrogenase
MAIAQMNRPLPVGGAQRETGEWHDVRSPYDDALIAQIAWGDAALALEAVDAAEAMVATARAMPAHERAAILNRAAQLIADREDDFASTICAEAGKPIELARTEAQRSVATFQAAAVAAQTLTGDVIPIEGAAAGEGKIAYTLRVPIGVVGAITPFNFPLNLVAHKVAPAIAAGCPVVLKPASKTPLTSLLLADLLAEAGLPDGWLNVVCGPASEIGNVLATDDRVRLITFTGSAKVGLALSKQAAPKPVSLELGNATPAIVMADADMGTVLSKLAPNAFAYAGQTCISVQRIYVERPLLDRVVDGIMDVARALRVGDPSDAATDVGPIIDSTSHERILKWIEEARAEGAHVLVGGEAAGESLIAPTVLVDVTPDMKVASQEVFGPVVSIIAFDTFEEAIALANATPYGLQAGIFTTNIDTALRASEQLEFGSVMVNETPSFRADLMPYGGTKQSGNTKEGPAHAVREMTEERLVVIQRGASY